VNSGQLHGAVSINAAMKIDPQWCRYEPAGRQVSLAEMQERLDQRPRRLQN
jgi:hypothetical protein